MKKQGRITLIILAGLLVAYIIAIATGMLKTFVIQASSNEPNMYPGTRIWFSSLAKPHRFDFICYKMDPSGSWDGGTWTMRLCGIPGDTIQIIDGTLFVNGKDADASLRLKKDYPLSAKGAPVIDSSTSGIESIYHQPWSKDNFGPITVPDGMFFVLGDNRHSAADSRYTGFIEKKKWVGTVISKF